MRLGTAGEKVMAFLFFKLACFMPSSLLAAEIGMKPIRKILAPTDLSEFSKIGVRYALTLARAVGAEVTVYRVVDYEDLIEGGEKMEEKAPDEGIDTVLPRMVKTAFDHYGEARAARSYYAPAVSPKAPEHYRLALRQFLKDNFSDLMTEVTVHEEVELGRSDERIVEEAKKRASDLIVMSTHGRSALAHVLRGSVTEHVIRNAPCPVVAIGPESVEKMQERLAAA
jgi:universal stress protein A